MPEAKKKFFVLIALTAIAGGFVIAGKLRATPSSAAPQSTIVSGDSNAASKLGEQKTLTGASWAPPGSEMTGTGMFIRMMLTVLLVLALGVGAVYISRKLLPRITNLPGKEVRVLETAHLGPRKQIHLVAAGRHRLLLASTNENITMLADITDVSEDFRAVLENNG